MALDSLAGIQEYRDSLEELESGTIVAMPAFRMAALLTLVFEEITRLQMIVVTGKESRLESVTAVSLHQRRKVKIGADWHSTPLPVDTSAPDLV